MVEAGLIFLADKKQRKGAYEKRPGQEIEPRQTPTDLVPPAFYRFPTMPSPQCIYPGISPSFCQSCLITSGRSRTHPEVGFPGLQALWPSK